MADVKISQLPAATTPLAGTEVLPIVQSGVTDKVTVANLTAGRVPAMNNAAMGYTSTTATAGTTTLTATSNHVQKLTGSTTQTYKLPDATTMAAGTAFIFDNDSTGLLTVVDNASGAVTTVPTGSTQYVFLESADTAAGSWGKYAWIGGAGALSITAGKSASVTNSLTLSGTDATTITFPTTSATIARTDAGQTFTGAQVFNDNIGLGNAPAAWNGAVESIDLSTAANINGSPYSTQLVTNAYYTAGGSWVHKTTGGAGGITVNRGTFLFSSAASGNAGATVSWSDVLSVDASGNLTISGATATKASGTTWANPSDIRLKDNVVNFEKGLKELEQVYPKIWEYNGKGGTVAGTKGIGVIADEIEQILPETVDTYKAKLNENDEEETDIKRFDATEITWLLVNAVKELSLRVKELEGK